MPDPLHEARRAFVRQNHPDVGGDPAVFHAGMSAFEQADRTVAHGRPAGLLGRLAQAAGERWHEVHDAFLDGYHHPDGRA